MHLLRRRLPTRVAAVGFLTALLVGLLGVTPAWAAAPTISSFSPTSGPVGTLVTIKGNNFNNPPVNSVEFDNHNAQSFTIVDDATIKATVPNDATDGRIKVHNADGTATSSKSFNVTGATAPHPTITSFTPVSGPFGTSVVITGTNFSGSGFTTTSVKFTNSVNAAFAVNSSTQITATVPTGTTSGPIKVTTPGGTATSAASFTVVTFHTRSVTLSLRRHLIARGIVTSTDAYAPCLSGVNVKVQKRGLGEGWRTVRNATTGPGGAYRARLPDAAGHYRSLVPRAGTVTDVCTRDASPRRRHRD